MSRPPPLAVGGAAWIGELARSGRLNRQFLGWSLLFSSALAVALSGWELLSWQRAIGARFAQVEQRLEQLYAPQLAERVAFGRGAAVEPLLSTIIRLEPIAALRLRTPLSQWHSGAAREAYEARLGLSVLAGGEAVDLGVIEFDFDRTRPETDGWAHARAALLLNALRALAVLVISWALFNYLVTRYLRALQQHLAQPLSRVIEHDLTPPPRRFARARNEVDQLVDEVGHLLARIERYRRRQREHNEEIRARLAERSAEMARLHAGAIERARWSLLDQVSARLAHEIRNPLGSMVINTRLLELQLSGSAERAVVVQLARLQRSTARCVTLVENLLGAMRRRHGAGQACDIAHLAARRVRQWRPRLPERVQLLADTGCGPQWASIDEQRFSQLLRNLLDNAVDAVIDSPAPAIGVELRADGPWQVLQVSDNGSGVPAALKDRLFEPLVSSKVYGMGMGLAVAAQIVSACGGQLHCESLARGTRFEAWLPRATAPGVNG